MSDSAVQQVIRRAASDASFRQQLQSSPSSALRGFDLTADESAAISSRDPGRLAAFGVDQRISKAFGIPGTGLNSDQMTDVPDATGGVARLEMESGETSGASVQDSSAASGATASVDSGIIGSGSTNAFDSGSAGSGATGVLDSGTAAAGAAPVWQDDPQPVVAAESGNPAWRDDAQPIASDSSAPAWRDDAQPIASDSSAPAWRDDAQPAASDNAPLSSLSAVHDVPPVDLGSDGSVHDVAPVDLSSDSISLRGDASDLGHSQIEHPGALPDLHDVGGGA